MRHANSVNKLRFLPKLTFPYILHLKLSMTSATLKGIFNTPFTKYSERNTKLSLRFHIQFRSIFYKRTYILHSQGECQKKDWTVVLIPSSTSTTRGINLSSSNHFWRQWSSWDHRSSFITSGCDGIIQEK